MRNSSPRFWKSKEINQTYIFPKFTSMYARYGKILSMYILRAVRNDFGSLDVKENRKIKDKEIGNHGKMMAENHGRESKETKIGCFHRGAKLCYCYSDVADKHLPHQTPQRAILPSQPENRSSLSFEYTSSTT